MGATMAVPTGVSIYELHSDGSMSQTFAHTCNFYIDDTQVHKIWVPSVASAILSKYGKFVGVMHRDLHCFNVQEQATPKYVLGS